MSCIKPASLSANDTVLLVSPSRSITKAEAANFYKLCREKNLKLFEGKYAFADWHNFGGKDEERLQDLQWAIDHPEAKAVFLGRGGYGLSRIIDDIDTSALKKYPKWFIGFSDATMLLNKVVNAGVCAIHGPVARTFGDNLQQLPMRYLFKALEGTEPLNYTFSHPMNRAGEAKAEIIGGNLAILCHSIATTSDLDYKGKVLFIEEVGEYLYRVDRLLSELKRAGKLAELKGLVVGHFSEMNDPDKSFGFNAYQLVQHYVKDYNYPVAYGFSAGHQLDNFCLMMGAEVKLNVKEKGQANLLFA